ncbi:transposase domain-containing protein [Paeniglutamicibacter gangotriensis]|uniref:Transposase IS4 N-terminal domain-containing protein n=1 Tax=Paeniglutamicibacter gangotriensis Lz1y TaxID=1276920 RepID=M7MYH3_9MICC|nr:transposase domain-containing protein [Paeniglutamicibacter gangotriensis]EMQ99995.1 hypothetical protein ADIAG_01104 [Paeniglutamicibacter gangotriensis Lz1y]
MPSSHFPAPAGQPGTPGTGSPAADRGHDTPVWAPAHLGALTEHLPAGLVDKALEATGTRERRIRKLPCRHEAVRH